LQSITHRHYRLAEIRPRFGKKLFFSYLSDAADRLTFIERATPTGSKVKLVQLGYAPAEAAPAADAGADAGPNGPYYRLMNVTFYGPGDGGVGAHRQVRLEYMAESMGAPGVVVGVCSTPGSCPQLTPNWSALARVTFPPAQSAPSAVANPAAVLGY